MSVSIPQNVSWFGKLLTLLQCKNAFGTWKYAIIVQPCYVIVLVVLYVIFPMKLSAPELAKAVILHVMCWVLNLE